MAAIWDFNKTKYREAARAIIMMAKPKWLIGSPPCTGCCPLNTGLNFPKMDPNTVRLRIKRAKTDFKLVPELYHLQIQGERCSCTSIQLGRAAGKSPASWHFATDMTSQKRFWTNANMVWQHPTATTTPNQHSHPRGG